MKTIKAWWLMLAIGVLPLFVSCGENDNDSEEFSNWKSRNDSYFENIRALALDSISQAKATYGQEWESHCNWRTFLSYSLEDTVSHRSTDSIYVQIVRKGSGTTSPISSDSARVNHLGRLIPSVSYPNGYVFGHSGQYTSFDKVFDPTISSPTMFYVGGVVRGFSTALQYMHIGDLWRIYIPYNLGYSSTVKESIPAYSTLIFEAELVAFYRNGVDPPAWQ